MIGPRILCLLVLAAPLAGQDLETARVQATRDREVLAEKLATFRLAAADERAAEATRLDALQAEVGEARAAWQDVSRAIAGTEATLADLDRREAAIERDLSFLRELLLEYRRGHGTRITATEAEQTDLASVDPALKTNLVAAATTLLTHARSTAERRLRVVGLPGRAMEADGTLLEGTVHVAGPLSWFEAETGQHLPLVTRANHTVPRLVRHAPLATGWARVDASGGKALTRAAEPGGLAAHLRSGGLVMIPLLLLGALAALVATLKFLQLYSVRTGAIPQVDKLLADPEGTVFPAGLWGRVFRRGLEATGPDPEAAGEAMQEEILIVLPHLERWLTALAVVAAAAPLVGLLGTVTGMIETFNVIREVGTGDPRPLSGGIGEALVTTEVGLVIAIPALIAHAMLIRRVRRIVGHLDEQVLHYVRGLRDGRGDPG